MMSDREDRAIPCGLYLAGEGLLLSTQAGAVSLARNAFVVFRPRPGPITCGRRLCNPDGLELA
jgi:hypothetical protein